MATAAVAMAAATATAATSVSRVWKLSPRSLPKGVSNTSDGVDQPRLALGLELAAQVGDVDLEGIGAGAEIVAPHLLEDPRPGEDHPRVAQEELQQAELGARELELALAPPDLHGLQVQHHVADLEH